jgi:hypothetical protein
MGMNPEIPGFTAWVLASVVISVDHLPETTTGWDADGFDEPLGCLALVGACEDHFGCGWAYFRVSESDTFCRLFHRGFIFTQYLVGTLFERPLDRPSKLTDMDSLGYFNPPGRGRPAVPRLAGYVPSEPSHRPSVMGLITSMRVKSMPCQAVKPPKKPAPAEVAPQSAEVTYDINIGSVPIDAEVWLDTRLTGHTPILSHPLTKGKHRVRMVSGTKVVDHTIYVGRRAPIHHTWNSEDGTWESGY